jgi:uncharacterized protein (TIRG00374 family)
MDRRWKKVVVLVLKIALLAGIIEYARRQSQFGDQIAVSSDRTATLEDADGRSIEVARGSRLDVVGRVGPDPNAPTGYRVVTKRGSASRICSEQCPCEISARDVEGAPSRAAGGGAPFSLLPGIRALFGHLDFGGIGWAFLAFGPALFLMGIRTRILLSAAGVDVPIFTMLRLHYLGFFFNTFMPGGAGGDIIKAVYLGRQSERKAEVATMVLVDRVVGVFGLLIMAGTVVLADYRELRGIAVQVGTISLVLTTSFVLYFSATFRRLLRLEWIISRLPRADVIAKVDAALYGLRGKRGALFSALVLTVGLQLLEVVGVSFAGGAVGIQRATFVHYLAFVPIGYLFNALPISFGGIGLMEGAYLKLFRDAGVATATQGFMLGVLARLVVIAWSLVGALSAMFPPTAETAKSPEDQLRPV